MDTNQLEFCNMNKMTVLSKELKEFIQTESNVYVALSGGVDSMALAHLIDELIFETNSQTRLHLIHINHQVSGLDEQWKDFVINSLETFLSTPILTVLNVSVDPKGSFENNARKVRFDAFSQHTNNILIGHTANDLSENILMNICKGRGVHGISSLKEYSSYKTMNIWRPMLHVNKTSLYQYMQENDYPYFEDITNKDNSIERCYIRNEVMPVLYDRYDNLDHNMNESYQAVENTQSVNNELIEYLIKSNTRDDVLDLLFLREFSDETISSVIVYLLRQYHCYRYNKHFILSVVLTIKSVLTKSESKNFNIRIPNSDKHMKFTIKTGKNEFLECIID